MQQLNTLRKVNASLSISSITVFKIFHHLNTCFYYSQTVHKESRKILTVTYHSSQWITFKVKFNIHIFALSKRDFVSSSPNRLFSLENSILTHF